MTLAQRLKYFSVCSGIEAATVAWHEFLDPVAFCERDAFPSAVLAHHYPGVPNMGDMTKWREWPASLLAESDILVGGTPCQAFSVAGLRNSLADDRGNLTLEFVRLADAIDDVRHAEGKPPAIVVWENVPGVLSTKDNAFGAFLAGLAGEDTALVPTGGRWTDAGVVDGPCRRIAWRILDAQFFGLAQRRRRVFVVASARDGFDPAAVLLEFEGVRRDTPPRREAGQAASGGTAGRAGERSHWDGLDNPRPTLNKGSGGVGASNQELFSQRGAYLVGAPEISPALNARDYKGPSSDGAPLVPVAFNARQDPDCWTERVGPLDTDGSTQAVAIPMQEVGKRTGTSTTDPRAGIGIGEDGDPMFTLQAGAQHGVAYPLDLRNAGRDPEKLDEVNRQGLGVGADGDPSPTISTAFVPGVAYAFQPRIARNGRGDMGDVVNALNAQSGETGKGDAAPCVATSMQVRRLTVVECSRLQGFPDDYLLSVTWRGKCPPADGVMYKALGNSMAVPVMAWIGRRIDDEISRASQSPEKDEAS